MIQFLETTPISHWRIYSGGIPRKIGRKFIVVPNKYCGISDLILLYNGKVLFLEIKTPTDSQRVSQKKFENSVKLCGGVYEIAKNITAVKKIITKELGYENEKTRL